MPAVKAWCGVMRTEMLSSQVRCEPEPDSVTVAERLGDETIDAPSAPRDEEGLTTGPHTEIEACRRPLVTTLLDDFRKRVALSRLRRLRLDRTRCRETPEPAGGSTPSEERVCRSLIVSASSGIEEHMLACDDDGTSSTEA